MAHEGFKTGKLTIGGKILTAREPSTFEIIEYDETTAKVERGEVKPLEVMRLTAALLHACVVERHPEMTVEEVLRSTSRDQLIAAFMGCMRIANGGEDLKGEAERA